MSHDQPAGDGLRAAGGQHGAAVIPEYVPATAGLLVPQRASSGAEPSWICSQTWPALRAHGASRWRPRSGVLRCQAQRSAC